MCIFRVENDDSITEDPSKQNGNTQDSSDANPFALRNAQQKSPAIGLSLRNLNSMRHHQQPPLPPPPLPITNGDTNHNAGDNQTIALDSESEMSIAQNQSYKRTLPKNPSSAKFEAFGKFVASSLIDLPEKNALDLVEKFTSEIVKTLIASKTATASPERE